MFRFLKIVLLSCVLICSLSLLSGCGFGQSDLFGYWMSADGEILHFISDNEVHISSYADDNETLCTYKILSDDKISYRIGDTVYVYGFSLDKQNSILTLYSGDADTKSIVKVYHGSDYMQEEIAVGLMTLQH